MLAVAFLLDPQENLEHPLEPPAGNKSSVLNAKTELRQSAWINLCLWPVLILDIQPNLPFSNGSCNLLTAECSQQKTVIMAVHWPPIPVLPLNGS